jgi:hypothetical protein
MTQLTDLRLDHTNLSGALPMDLGLLTLMEYLYLGKLVLLRGLIGTKIGFLPCNFRVLSQC